MKLSIKLALLNIRRYPLRVLGSAVCMLFFSFALFSAVMFTRSLSGAVTDVLRTRSSGNTVTVKTNIDELESISKNPDILEVRPYYRSMIVFGEIVIEGLGEFDIDLNCEQAPDIKSLIPNVYLDEFRVIGGKNLLVAGRMPENSGEMILCESWFKNQRISDYDLVLNKQISLLGDYVFDERIVYLENAKLVGIYSEDFLGISALNGYTDWDLSNWAGVGFLLNPESNYRFIEAFCTIDKIDKVFNELCEIYDKDMDWYWDGSNVYKSVWAGSGIEKLSGLNSFIGKLMILAAGAVACIYVVIQLISASNYFKEKSVFITAADAFGCGKPNILGAFAAENIALIIPVSIISAVLSCSFIKLIFRIILAYLGMDLDVTIDLGAVFIAAALMPVVELLVLLISLLLFRKKSND